MPELSHFDGALRVSLVIPVQDEEATVGTLLETIAAQTRLPDEVILVNAGSKDATVARALEVPLPRGLLRVLDANRVHPGVARNLGVAAASHPWIAFTDAGIRLVPEWLQALLDALGNPTAEVVYGSYEPVCDTFLRQCAALVYVSPRNNEGARGPFVASMLVRRDLFQRLGGFPVFRAAEDLIFLENIRVANPITRVAPKAIARWSTAGTVRQTFRRFALYSFHNLVAGRGRYWHVGVARLYIGLAAILLAQFALGIRGPFLGLSVIAFYLARVARAAWNTKGSLPFGTMRLQHLFGGAALLVVIDAATMAGALRWLTSSSPKQG